MNRCVRWVAAAGSSLVALALPACRSAPSLEPGAGLTIVRDLPAGGSLDAADLYSDASAEATYTIVAGNAKGRTLSFTRRTTEKYGAAVREEFKGQRTEFLSADGGGNVVLHAVIDNDNNALTLFDPPLVVLPASLSRDEPFEARSAMRVVDAGNPSKEKERGTAVRSVTYVGDRLIDTSIGEIACHRLQVIFSADLRMADAETHSTLYVASEYGLVAEQSSEVVKVFGALSSEKGEVIVLSSEPK